MCDKDRKSSGLVAGLVAGAALTVGAVYFFTKTATGKKLGHQIKEKGEDLADNLEDLVADIQDQSREFQKKAVKLEHQIQETVVDKAEEIQEDVAEKLADIKEDLGKQISHLAEINEDVSKLQDQGRQAVNKFFSRHGKPLS